jgi:hypothetical protein
MLALKRYLWIICVVSLSWAHCAVLCPASEWEISSETILRTFQRNTVGGDDRRVLPLYEYLQVDYSDRDAGGLAFQGYGWIRKDTAESDYYEDDPEGNLIYACLSYSRPHSPHRISFGRQHIFAGAADDSVDGLRVDLGLNRLLSLSAYGGIPVHLEETEGRSQDTIYGGRLALLFAPNAELGISYKNLRDNGEAQEQTVGTDLYWSPLAQLSFDGRSAYNSTTNGWQEHNYSAQVDLGPFKVVPLFQYVQYQDYFDPAENRSNLFRFLFNSEEVLTSWGLDAFWSGLGQTEIGFRSRHYDYDLRQTEALYLSGLLTLNLTSKLTMGAEVGNMAGETSEDRYQLYRVYCAWSAADLLGASGQVSADLLFQSFDEAIYGVDKALLVSLSAGRSFINAKSFVKASLNYSQDPFFDDDLSGIMTFLFVF